MRIAFANFGILDFNVASVDTMPLGGSHSAACYLARELAWQGHEVFLLSNTSSPGVHHGVMCLSLADTSEMALRSLGLNALVCMLRANVGPRLREQLPPQCKVILWAQHAPDQKDVASLRDEKTRRAFDALIMVSQWQREAYQQIFGIEPSRTVVLQNAIAPAFAAQFPGAELILAVKANPQILAYTSTPFRGLDILLDAFGDIRAAEPAVRLQVFSSMKLYGAGHGPDEQNNSTLYDRCRNTQGVEYFGSTPQRELARALKAVSVLAYPNTFPETSCIAAMEAMASGCRIVSSQACALPETTAGFARLVPNPQDRAGYLPRFVEQVIAAIRQPAESPVQTEAFLRRQVDFANANYTWPIRARQWVQFLSSL